MENQNQYSTEAVIMAALSTLTPPQLSHLTTSISYLFNRHHRRLASLLSSPPLFSLALHHLNSLSLFHKSQLIARHLLSNLTHLTHFLHNKTSPPPSSHPSTSINLRDLDAVLLLLLFCELRQHLPKALDTSPTEWRLTLCNYYVYGTMLTLSGISVSSSEVLSKFIELVTKCITFVSVMDCGGGGGREVAASAGVVVAASAGVVVALPSVEVKEGGKECVVCKEEMGVGRDVCELPCNHLFHWICILPWLSKTNTCPCCRYRLPTDDVSGEIERLWEVLVGFACGSYDTSVKQLIS